MTPRMTLITLGVDDLQRAVAFYRDGLGLATDVIVGSEFEHGAVASSAGRTIGFEPLGRTTANPAGNELRRGLAAATGWRRAAHWSRARRWSWA